MLGLAAVLATACSAQQEAKETPESTSLGPRIERAGVVYTPVSVDSRGCVLYNVQIPDGQAPAALVYQSTDGQFTYARPDQCVRTDETQ